MHCMMSLKVSNPICSPLPKVRFSGAPPGATDLTLRIHLAILTPNVQHRLLAEASDARSSCLGV